MPPVLLLLSFSVCDLYLQPAALEVSADMELHSLTLQRTAATRVIRSDKPFVRYHVIKK